MLKKLCYILSIIFNNFLIAENHKILSFAGSDDFFSWIYSSTEYYYINNKDIVTSLEVKDRKIKYEIKDKKINFDSKHSNSANTPNQNFLLIKLDHSFDELTDNIYFGFSIAGLYSNFTAINKQVNIASSFYQTKGIGGGGYIQWQNEEGTDYGLFVKISALILAQTIACKQIHDSLISDKIMIKNLISSPLTIGILAMLQAGFKIGDLEISAFIACNKSAKTVIKINETNNTRNCDNWYIGINIGFLFK